MNKTIRCTKNRQSQPHNLTIMDDMTEPHSDHLTGDLRHRTQLLGRAVEPPRTIIAVAKLGIMLCEHHLDIFYDTLSFFFLMQIETHSDSLLADTTISLCGRAWDRECHEVVDVY